MAVELGLEDRVARGRTAWPSTSRCRRAAAASRCPRRAAGAARCRCWRRSRARMPSSTNGSRRCASRCLGDGGRVARRLARAGAGRRTRRRRGGRRCRTRAARRRSRRETSWSSRSPMWWPSVSLISLKWSRSMIITTAVSPLRRAARTAWSMRSRKSSRFGRPVSASCSAWCSLAIASRPPRCTAKSGRKSRAIAGSAEVGGEHDDRREAEQQAVDRGLEEEVARRGSGRRLRALRRARPRWRRAPMLTTKNVGDGEHHAGQVARGAGAARPRAGGRS